MRFALVRVGVDGSARRGEPSALARASAGRGKAPRWPSAVRCPPGLQIAVTVGVICGSLRIVMEGRMLLGTKERARATPSVIVVPGATPPRWPARP